MSDDRTIQIVAHPVSVDERTAAAMTGFGSVDSFRRHARHRIPHVRCGDHRLFLVAELERFVRENQEVQR